MVGLGLGLGLGLGTGAVLCGVCGVWCVVGERWRATQGSGHTSVTASGTKGSDAMVGSAGEARSSFVILPHSV